MHAQSPSQSRDSRPFADGNDATCTITESSISSDDPFYDGLTPDSGSFVSVAVTVEDREQTAVGLGAVSAETNTLHHPSLLSFLIFLLLSTLTVLDNHRHAKRDTSA